MKKLLLGSICLFSFLLTGVSRGDGYIEADKLSFETPYKWNSAVVAAAFAVTPMEISGMLGNSNVTLMQVKDYELTSDTWMLWSWTNDAINNFVDGIDEDDKILALQKYEELLAVFEKSEWNFSLSTAYSECVRTFVTVDLMPRDTVKNYCAKFVKNMVNVNNELAASDYQTNQPLGLCKGMVANNGLGYPVVCGGRCATMFGDDTLGLYYGKDAVYTEKFDDICEGSFGSDDFWYVFCNGSDFKKYESKDKALENLNSGC